MTEPFTDYVTVDDLRRMTNHDLDKYRTRSWANAVWSLPRKDLEQLAEGRPDPRTDPAAWKQGLAGWLARGLLGDPGAGRDELARPRARRRPPEREVTGRDLAERFLHPGLQRTLKTMLDELEERSDGTREDIARVMTAQYLKALQLFTYAARVPAGTIRTQEDFASAASYLLARGDRFGATILLGFGYYVSDTMHGPGKYLTGGDVYGDHVRWAERHRYRQALAAAGPRRPVGRALRGADGSAYTLDQRVVTVLTAGGGTETVTFATPDAALDWLASRSPAADGPLLTTAGGPACRTAREDEILARLLHDPGDDMLRAQADADMFTSHLRAELYNVLTLCGPGQARDRFAGAMLRAPGWALGGIGWPDARRALRYFDRLAATPVSAAQAHEAALAVGEAAERAENRHLASATAKTARRHRVPPPPSRRAVTPRRPLLAPPPAAPVPAGQMTQHRLLR